LDTLSLHAVLPSLAVELTNLAGVLEVSTRHPVAQ
jgi:hypothetical protein